MDEATPAEGPFAYAGAEFGTIDGHPALIAMRLFRWKESGLPQIPACPWLTLPAEEIRHLIAGLRVQLDNLSDLATASPAPGETRN